MANKLPKLPSHLFLTLYSGKGLPLSLKINLHRLALLAVTLFTLLALSVTGSLFFFRELEINRKLSNRVLEYEVKERLAKNPPALESLLPSLHMPQPTSLDYMIEETPVPAAPEKAPVVAPTAGPLISKAGEVKKEAKAEPSRMTSSEIPSQARLGDLSVDCTREHCGIKVALVPSSTGMTEGHLLVVLETEIPRIGTAVASGNVRKNYFIYPGHLERAELNAQDISQIEGKPFRFSRILQTTVDFTLGSKRPLAANIYLFDANKNLIHHERKPIEVLE